MHLSQGCGGHASVIFFSIGQYILFLSDHQLLTIAVRDEGVPAYSLLVIKFQDGFTNKSGTNRTKYIMFLFRCRLVFVVMEGELFS